MSLSPLKNKQIEAFHDKGMTVKEIGRKTHCSHAEIRQLLKSKGKEPIEDKVEKEKELATAATVTSSTNDVKKQDVSKPQYITTDNKSQGVLKKVKDEMSKIYNRLSDQNKHAWDLGVVYADVCHALEEEAE